MECCIRYTEAQKHHQHNDTYSTIKNETYDTVSLLDCNISLFSMLLSLTLTLIAITTYILKLCKSQKAGNQQQFFQRFWAGLVQLSEHTLAEYITDKPAVKVFFFLYIAFAYLFATSLVKVINALIAAHTELEKTCLLRRS